MSAMLIASALAAAAAVIPVVNLEPTPARPTTGPACAVEDQGRGRAMTCRIEADATVHTLVLQVAPQPAPCRTVSRVVVLAESRPAAEAPITVQDGQTDDCRR